MSKAEKNLQKMMKEANARHANMKKAMSKVYDAPPPKTKKTTNISGDYSSITSTPSVVTEKEVKPK